MSSAFSFPRCVCSHEDAIPTLFSIDNILQCQKASDFLISLAYFSIPLELFYFVSCSTIFPFRWIFLQFGAFIVLCGLTHLVNVWTYEPHSFHLMLTLTILKFLTALVSCATSITLATLLPQMLRVMVREGLLRKKTRELGREVGMMKRQEEASWHVRMLTQEIRRSLNRHTILYTTLVELSKVLFLENCAIWMPDEEKKRGLVLTHELNRTDSSDRSSSIPIHDPDVEKIVGQKGAVVLGPNSRLRRGVERGPVAAVRMPMLMVSNFKGGTLEFVEACYAVLVLVLPLDGNMDWGSQELEIVEVVADQVAVALSHAAVLEESMLMREKLMEQNRDLKCAGEKAVLANEARSAFRKVMSGEMAGPVRSVTAILSVLQRDEKLGSEQRRIVDGMAKGSLLLSSLVEDALDDASNSEGRLVQLELCPFSLRSMLKEVVSISELLCTFRGLSLDFDIPKEVPEIVIGDEKRLLKAVIYMVGNVASCGDQGNVILLVCTKGGSWGNFDPKNLGWKQCEEFIQLKFEVSRIGSSEDVSSFLTQKDEECSGKANNQGLSFTICKKLAQLMHGSISVSTNPQGQQKSMNLTIRLQLKRSLVGLARPRYMGPKTPESLLNGMNILLADCDSFNRSITRKLLGKTGCHLTVVSSWYQCLETLHLNGSEFDLLLIDLCILEENIHEVCALVRRLRSERWLLVVAMTSKADKDTRDRCLLNGMNGIIGKPVILQEMADELQQIIQKVAQVPSPPFNVDLQS